MRDTVTIGYRTGDRLPYQPPTREIVVLELPQGSLDGLTVEQVADAAHQATNQAFVDPDDPALVRQLHVAARELVPSRPLVGGDTVEACGATVTFGGTCASG